MSISNSKYDAIMRTYEEKRIRNRHILEDHKEEVYELIPEYKQLDAEIGNLSVEQGRKLIGGDESALSVLREKVSCMVNRKAELLSEYGFPADYLKPIYNCPDCKDTGYIGTERCTCLKQEIIRELYSQSNIEAVLETENFDNLSYEYYNDSDVEKMRHIVDECKDFASNFNDEYENLLLLGNVGVGKTYLTNCIAGELLKKGNSVIYFTSNKLFDTLAKYAFKTGENEDDLSEIHDDVFSCDLLIIDDLGTEMTNSFVSSQLFTILNERNIRKKSTIISTNLSFEQLSEKYSDRTFSRIYGFYKMLKIEIDDIRITKKRKQNALNRK